MTPTPANHAALASAGWTLVQGREAIEKHYTFKTFSEAFGWMTRAAMIAETLDHHPEWSNVYNRVHVVLTTHSTGGLSLLDLELARAMDQMYGH